MNYRPSLRRAFLLAAISLIMMVLIFISYLLIPQPNSIPPTILFSLILLLAGLRAGELFLRYLMEELTIQDTNASLRIGVLITKDLRIQLAYVKNIQIRQNIVQKLFGVGDLTFFTTASEEPITIQEIANPFGVQEDLWNVISGATPKVQVSPTTSQIKIAAFSA